MMCVKMTQFFGTWANLAQLDKTTADCVVVSRFAETLCILLKTWHGICLVFASRKKTARLNSKAK